MEKLLTIVVPNWNRLANNHASHFFFKSLEWQTDKRFHVTIIDGGSKNFDEVKAITKKYKIDVNFLQYRLKDVFLKPVLNNIAIRSAKTKYIAATDADMLYAPKFIETVINNLKDNTIVESRTLYWKDEFVKKIYYVSVKPRQN